jgi:hypothetical protein
MLYYCGVCGKENFESESIEIIRNDNELVKSTSSGITLVSSAVYVSGVEMIHLPLFVFLLVTTLCFHYRHNLCPVIYFIGG